MADLSAIRTAIGTRLATVTGLRHYANWPDQVNCPCALVKPIRWDCRQAIGNVNRATFEVVVLAAPLQNGLEHGQEKLDTYLDDTGATTSIKAALEVDKTLAGTVSTLHVPGWRDYGTMEVGEISYVGARIELEIWC